MNGAGSAGGGPDGVLVVDKRAGPTSHDVVNHVRRLLGTRRVGHAGTLDPPATGVLVIGVGRATRLLRFLQALEKVYEATVAFGTTTTTQDATGDVVERRPCAFGPDDLREAAAGFVGAIRQVPPMMSAVKVRGEPLHRAARRGEVVDRAPRTVHVHELTVAAHRPGDAPEADLRVRCSSGTFVRTLAADLGERLGCGAHLRLLRRLAVGSFTVAEAVTLDALEALDAPARRACLLPMAAALRDFPAVSVAGAALAGVRHGRPLPPGAPPADRDAVAGAAVAVLDPAGDLVAVYEGDDRGGLRPAAVLAAG